MKLTSLNRCEKSTLGPMKTLGKHEFDVCETRYESRLIETNKISTFRRQKSRRDWIITFRDRARYFAPGVGENLHNHVSYTLSWTINQPNLYDLTWASATEYIAFQKGPMASTGLSQLTGLLPSVYTTPDHPDIQLFFGGYHAACATTGEVGAVMNGNGRRISISPTMTQPRSKGKRRNNPKVLNSHSRKMLIKW